MRRRYPLLLGSLLAVTAAAPAAAAEVEIKGLDVSTTPRAAGGAGWDKENVTIAPGDTVRWTFTGTTLPHNVMANSPNWNLRTTYDAPAAAVRFDTPGRYDFKCEVHADTMFGTVVVGEPPPPPLSEQPWLNDGGGVSALETGGLDTVRPALSAVRAKRRARGARVTFRVSERADVTVRVKRGRRTVKSKHAATRGRGSVTVGGLKAGRYAVKVTATDIAGNTSRSRSASFRIR